MTAPRPAAASRWLDRAVPVDAPTPARVRVKQRGSMEAQDRWLSFTATAVYQADPMMFEWRARLRVLPLLWVVARDGHAGGEGWGSASLLGIKTISERRGPEVLPIQLIRNLAELAFAPEIAPGAPSLTWREPDDAMAASFWLAADAGNSEAAVRFDVDEAGDVVRTWSPARPIDVPEGFETAPWRCDFGGHRELDGVRIPTTVVATYEFEDEPWEYFRGEVLAMERELE